MKRCFAPGEVRTKNPDFYWDESRERSIYATMSEATNTIDNVWTERWQALLSELDVEVRRWRGQLNVAGCRVEQIDVGVGEISAQVQDRDWGLCQVRVQVTPFRDEQWTRLLDALGERTFFVAQLLAGELPAEIDQIFAEVGVHLVPTSLDEVANSVTCALNDARRRSGSNRAVAALYAALMEMIEDDPWLLFRLRGRTQQQILQALRQRRQSTALSSSSEFSLGANGAVEPNRSTNPSAGYGWVGRAETTNGSREQETGTPTGAESVSLRDQVDAYWGSTKALEGLHHYVAPPGVELALLRRLGPPLSTDSLALYDQLSQVYRQMSDRALALAYATFGDAKSE